MALFALTFTGSCALEVLVVRADTPALALATSKVELDDSPFNAVSIQPLDTTGPADRPILFRATYFE